MEREEEVKQTMKKVNDHLRKKYCGQKKSIPIVNLVNAQEGVQKAKDCLDAYLEEDNRELRKNFEFVLEKCHIKDSNSFDGNNVLLYSFKYALRELGAEKLFIKYFRNRNRRVQEQINRDVNSKKELTLNEISAVYYDHNKGKCIEMHRGIKHAAECLKFMLCKDNVEQSALVLALKLFKKKGIKSQHYFDGFRAMMFHKYNKRKFYSKFVKEARKVKK